MLQVPGRAAAHRPPAESGIAFAAAVVAAVVATEYLFRHFVLFWMPVLGNRRVNDMLSLAMAYGLLIVAFGVLVRVDWRDEFRRMGAALREFATRWTFTPWLLGLMFALVVLPPVDRWLWVDLHMPMWVSSVRHTMVLWAQAAWALDAAARLSVNGVLVPVAEEFLWRGLVQARLLRVWPAAVAIGVTAFLFSLKHVVVDASWGRFLTLTAFGTVCGVVAWRHGWRSAAALHLVVNSATTAVAVAMGE